MYDLFGFLFENSFLFRGLLLFILGGVIGSFLNVVIYRLPIMLKHKWNQESSDILGLDNPPSNLTPFAKFNLLFPGSHCPKCNVRIPFWANIPIFGYLILSGKCFNCKDKISLRYPLVELISGILFVLAGYLSNELYLLAAYLIFISVSICIILIDYDTFILPDELTLPLMWLGIITNLRGEIAGSLTASVLGAVIGYLSLWLLFWLYKFISKKEGLGYGDFKFASAILAFFGIQYILVLLLLSSAFGILYFVGRKIIEGTSFNQPIPFGPFLGGAGILIMFISHFFGTVLL